ncbi:hypothetical protein F5050DRAFT_1708473 [Lentinula boryana]|uniref:Uncharacterized protein n=1 Tax=Lentinula boryana TaxID=40481 RepID=A0ABQ8QRS2_9AGAR|nr:hypothetical protein F5050DRAFT_1708473 [Lentinula boryana]
MSKRRAPSISSASSVEHYSKVRLVAQPSREARQLKELLLQKDQMLEDAETELDDLMEFLESERKEILLQQTIAEIKAERLQRRVNALEVELHKLQLMNTKSSIDRTSTDAVAQVGYVSEASHTEHEQLSDRGLSFCQETKIENHKTHKAPGALSKEGSGVIINISAPKIEEIPQKLPLYPTDALHSENAQKWFPATFKYLNQDLGEDYITLLVNWVNFERSRGWVSSVKGLACNMRPKVLSKWILNCRYDRTGNEPDFADEDDLRHFCKSFMFWWNTLQNSCRLVEGLTAGKKWESLDRSGKNGWLSVLACLKWWGMALGEQDDREGSKGCEWRTVVKDASLVLNSLIASTREKK